MKKMICVFAVFAGIVSSSLHASGFKDAQVAMVSGNWKVLRAIDSMYDKVICTGVYKDNYEIQLGDDGLYISIKGGIEMVTLRFGDKPARPMRLPEKIEKKIGSIIVTGPDFTELIESDRLRVQADTLVRGIVEEDINLKGLKEALESIKANCPIQPVSSKLEMPLASTCSSELIGRMKAQGLKNNQIASICR